MKHIYVNHKERIWLIWLFVCFDFFPYMWNLVLTKLMDLGIPLPDYTLHSLNKNAYQHCVTRYLKVEEVIVVNA